MDDHRPKPINHRKLVIDTKADLLFSPKGPSDTLVICFTGLREHFGLPIVAFDAVLSTYGVSAIYLRDRAACGYALGIKSLADNLDGSIEELQEIVVASGARRLLVFGNSIGCMGAGVFGLRMKAQSIALFAPVISGSSEFRSSIHDTRASTVAHRGEAVMAERSGLHYWLDAQIHDCPIDVVYGPRYRLDAAHATSLQRFAQVTLHPMDEIVSHSALLELHAAGRLTGILDGLLMT